MTPPRVFISHATADTEFATVLAEHLRAAGVDVWLDVTHLGPDNFVDRINRALAARDVLLLVLSPAALVSRWVPEEMNAAIVRYKQGFMRSPVVVVAQPCPLAEIPPLWTGYNRIEATTGVVRALPRVLRALGVADPPQHASPPSTTVSHPAAGSAVVSPSPSTTPQRDSMPLPGPARSGAGRRWSRYVWAAMSLIVVVATSGALLHFLSPSNLPLMWRRATSGSVQALGAAHDTVYAVTGDYPTSGTVYALGASDGALKWHSPLAYPNEPLRVLGDTIYVGALDGAVYAFATSDGTLKWRYQTGRQYVGTPTVVAGIVYVTASSDADPCEVYALAASDGTFKWRYPIGGTVTYTPVVSDNIVYVGADAKKAYAGSMYALSAKDGTLMWQYQAGVVDAGPFVAGGVVYFTANVMSASAQYDGYAYALGASDGALEWRYDGVYAAYMQVSGPLVYVATYYDQNVMALGAADGTPKWHTHVDSNPLGVAVIGDTVLGTSSSATDCEVFALGASDGALKWQYRMGAQERAWQVTGSTIYLGASNGSLDALAVGNGTLKWHYQLDKPLATWSDLLTLGQVVYAGTEDGTVYALKA